MERETHGAVPQTKLRSSYYRTMCMCVVCRVLCVVFDRMAVSEPFVSQSVYTLPLLVRSLSFSYLVHVCAYRSLLGFFLLLSEASVDESSFFHLACDSVLISSPFFSFVISFFWASNFPFFTPSHSFRRLALPRHLFVCSTGFRFSIEYNILLRSSRRFVLPRY